MHRVIVGRKNVVYSVIDCIVLMRLLADSKEEVSDPVLSYTIDNIQKTCRHNAIQPDADTVELQAVRANLRLGARPANSVQLRKGFVVLVPIDTEFTDFVQACRDKTVIILGRSTLNTLFVTADDTDVRLYMERDKEKALENTRALDL